MCIKCWVSAFQTERDLIKFSFFADTHRKRGWELNAGQRQGGKTGWLYRYNNILAKLRLLSQPNINLIVFHSKKYCCIVRVELILPLVKFLDVFNRGVMCYQIGTSHPNFIIIHLEHKLAKSLRNLSTLKLWQNTKQKKQGTCMTLHNKHKTNHKRLMWFWNQKVDLKHLS